MIYHLSAPRFGRFFTVPCGAVEKYISTADGNQYKVLLCILCSDGDTFDTAEIAARVDISPAEAEDALIFWTSRGIISAQPAGEDSSAERAVPAVNMMKPVGTAPAAVPVSVQTAPVTEPAAAVTEDKPVKPKTVAVVRYSPKELADKAKDEPEVAELFEQIQRIFGRPFRGSETAGLINLWEYYGFSAASIIILAQFAHDLGKNSVAYLETVAKDWFARGITEYAEIEREIERLTERNRLDSRIKTALGVEGALTKKQQEFFEQWCVWGFDVDTIDLAGQRCREQKNKTELRYINGILRRWHEDGLMTVRAVLESERKFSEGRSSAAKKDTAETENSSISVDKWYELAESFDPWAAVNGTEEGGDGQ